MSADLTLAAALADGRAESAVLQTSRVTIRRRTSRDGMNDDTDSEQASWVEVATNEPCRIKAARSRTVSVGSVDVEQGRAEAHLRYDFDDLASGDLIEVTAGEWPGAVWRVVEPIKGDQRTARRVEIEESSVPQDGWS